jgi:hypothetical protein
MRFWSEPRPLKCERAIYKVKVKNWLSKVQSVDQRMRMRCRFSPTADVPSHTSGAAMWV